MAGPGEKQLFGLEQKADRVMWYNKSREFDLNLGPIEDDARSPVYLKFSQIEWFLQWEKHKGMVVVWFDKSVMWNEKNFIAQRAGEVTGQMKKVGYARVIILGAHSNGIHYVADSKFADAEQRAGGNAVNRTP